MEKKKKFQLKNLGKNIFAKFFGFEQGIDITNDVEVLYRRNAVIKTIIFVSNITYTIILLILSLSNQGTRADWVVTFVSFPVTYVINRVLKSLIFTDKDDRVKQNVAMYVGAFYIFISAILMYVKLHRNIHLETGAYILVYYSLVVISLYQEKKLLLSIFQILLAALTFIHFIWTYDINSLASGLTLREFIPVFITLPEFADFIFRTSIFILFYVVLFSIVSMGQYMQEERKNELIKRRQVQNDFSNIVGDLFSVVMASSHMLMDQDHAHRVNFMSKKLAHFYGYNDNKMRELERFSLIHLKYKDIKSLSFDSTKQSWESYENLKQNTELGSKIAKRLQLAQKSTDIMRFMYENTLTEKFINEMRKIQPETDSEIILLSDLYITLRDVKAYKRPMNHGQAIKAFKDYLYVFFSFELYERFLKFEDEFEKMYHEF